MLHKPFTSRIFFLSTIILLFIASCNPGKKAQKEEDESILAYINQNPTKAFERKPSGLYYYEVLTGQGEIAQKSDTAYVRYTGTYLDGTMFDTNIRTQGTDTLIRPVNEGWLIEGFDEGLTYMRHGGKAIFLIPSSLGYGSSGYSFPAYTPMLFTVEMLKLVPGPGK